MIRLSNIRLPLDYDGDLLKRRAAEALGARLNEIADVKLNKLSVDARDKRDVHFVSALNVELAYALNARAKLPKNAEIAGEAPVWRVTPDDKPPEYPPVVVGLGPAGLFAALTLAMRGLNPLVIERGQPVDARARDVEKFMSTGELSESSNVQFGEGGAGAFSDGKLNTGIKDVRCAYVLRALYEAGAPEDILYRAKPHIGTDKLRGVVRALRRRIIELGGRVEFGARLTDIIVERGCVAAITVQYAQGARTIPANDVILCAGHSARDTFCMLNRIGAPMERKPFSIGARIEHSQSWLNQRQYGAFCKHPALGAADYKLNTRASSGRGVYTFCMCPGGQVIAAASEMGGVVVNGMSLHSRDGENANSALLADVRVDDFPPEDGVLAGVVFQRHWEARAFETGGGGFIAPAQLAGDFLSGRASRAPGDVRPSYRPGVNWTSLDGCLPDFALDAMREALIAFDRVIPGFAARSAVLTGVETRSSSPVRILRNPVTLSSDIRGLYPAGEGAGYAGGILSAAVDGIRCAEMACGGRASDISS